MNVFKFIPATGFLFHLFVASLSLRAEEALTDITLANGEWPPFQSEMLPDYGTISKIVSEAFALEGVKVHYRFFPWLRAINDARAGQVDGTLIFSANEQRRRDFLISDPVMFGKMILYFPKARHPEWRSLADLANLRLGVGLGSEYCDEFHELQRVGRLKLDVARTEDLSFAKLAIGRIDALIIEQYSGLAAFAAMGEGADLIEADPTPACVAPMGVLISRKTANGPELLRRFNLGLKKLQQNGDVERWLNNEDPNVGGAVRRSKH